VEWKSTMRIRATTKLTIIIIFIPFNTKRILGVEFWEAKAKERAKPVEHGERRFDRRHVQAVLRTYKTGSAAAILTHTGDPNEGLRMWMKKKDEPVVIDHDAIKAEISKLRGEKLTKIAQWR